MILFKIVFFSMSLDLTTKITFWNTVAAVLITMTCNLSFHQNCAQRLVSLPTLKKAKRFKQNSMLIFGTFPIQNYSSIFAER